MKDEAAAKRAISSSSWRSSRTTTALEAYLGGEEPDAETLQALHPQGHGRGRLRAGAVRLGLQEQGRAAAARRGRRVSAGADRRRRRSRASRWARTRPIVRHASDDEPFAGLAFKIMSDPFVGSLTFIRIYSGVLNTGSQVLNTVKNQRERIGRMLLMHANHREDVKEARAGDILALAGLKNTTTGDTLSDPGAPGRARTDGVPGAGHRDRGRAEDQGRPGKDGPGAGAARHRGPVVPGRGRSRERPDRDQGDGRAAPRDHRRPHEARVQGRRQYRRAAGRLSRDDHPPVRDRLHAQEADRRRRAVCPGQDPLRAAAAGQRVRVRELGGRRRRAEGIRAGRREGAQGLDRERRARRLPGDRPEGRADRRRLSRRRFRACWRSRSPPAPPSRKAS